MQNEHVHHYEQHPGREKAEEALTAFVYNPGLDAFVALHDGPQLPLGQDERLGRMREFAANTLDHRKGQERQATDKDPLLDHEGSPQWRAAFRAGDMLGQVESTRPANTHPKYLVLPAGYGITNTLRGMYGESVIEDCEHVVFLASARAVGDKEREEAGAPEAQDEFDLCCAYFEGKDDARVVHEFNQFRNGEMWRTKMYEYTQNGKTRTGWVQSTPRQVDGHRATTDDNFHFFGEQAELADDPEASVVIATNSLYAPFQHLVALKELTLKYGVDIETVGYSADEYSSIKPVTRLPSQLEQEAKAAVDAAVRLDEALAA